LCFDHKHMKYRYSLYLLLLLSSLVQYAYAQSPIEFIENQGQWDGPFRYKAMTGKSDIYLQTDGITYLIGDPSNDGRIDGYEHGQVLNPPILKYHAYKMSFVGALAPEIVGSKEEPSYFNYFLGKDPKRWKSGIHPYMAMDYKQLWEGINMHLSSTWGNLEYEFVIQPGADAHQVQLQFEGADKLSIKEGSLIIGTSVGTVQEMKPYAYQYINGNRVQVACNYKLKGTMVSYNFPNDYDATQTLVIDPTVVFATFTGSTADNWGFTATYDNQGNFYAGGIAHGPGFPTSVGAFQLNFAGGVGATGTQYGSDVAIIKYNPLGTNRIYATYIGGSINERPHSMIVDAYNNLIIAGRTNSPDYPVTSGAYDVSFNGDYDIMVTKLNAAGTALLGSTYIGGSGPDGVNFDSTETYYGGLKHNYGDDARSEVQVDKLGQIYITGSTQSIDFPTTVNALQSSLQGTQDGIVCKFDSNLTSLVWSTYIGGSNQDAGYVMVFDTAQTSLYVAGGTQSPNFPTTAGTLYPTYQGDSADGFILKFQNSAPYTLQAGTFMGTSGYDQVYGIQVDANDNVYAMGQALGGQFPVQPTGVYSNPSSSQFVIKMNNTLSSNIFSTVFGKGDPLHTDISPVAFLVDTCQNIYISGWGGNLFINTMPVSIGNTTGLPITANALQSTTDGRDFYFIVLSKNIQSLLYATFMGEPTGVGEHVDGGTSRFDKNGIVYQAICGGCGGSSAFPTTPGAWSNINNGLSGGIPNCNEIALKIRFDLGSVNAQAQANPTATGCAPLQVQFSNGSVNATSYTWDFGDMGTSTAVAPSHTFMAPGVYTVTMVAYNPNACKEYDTVKLQITVLTNSIKPGFNAVVTDSCGPYTIGITNTSQYSATPGAQTFTTFTWSFGDGGTATGANPGGHSYADTGTYLVTMTMKDTTACNSPDTVTQVVHIGSQRMSATFNVPDALCSAHGITLVTHPVNATSVLWTLGDGATSNLDSFKHVYDSAGTYIVKLFVSNPNTCEKIDSFSKAITISLAPTAQFTFTPNYPEINTPTTFINSSTNAVSYMWNFGDGENSSKINPVHQYNVTNSYTVCLTAIGSSGCTDSICKIVPTEVQPIIDIPTAFSPNGDGENDILYVRGVAIKTMDLRIFNRWGQLVFESTSQADGWDGSFNGKQQEQDAYAYVLTATFYDKTTYQKKGNVTLIR